MRNQLGKVIDLFKGVSKNKFIIIFGDEGLILLHIQHNKLINRVFSSSFDLNNDHPFSNIINNDPKGEILVILETIDQNYTIQSLPAVSALSINKLVQRYITKNFDDNQLVGAIYIDREKSGRKDWRYMFISEHISKKMQNLIDFISAKPNLFIGFHFLPLESQNVISTLAKNNINKTIKSNTRLGVFYTKTGGLRQVVIHNDKVVFTRLITQKYAESSDVIAGTIVQEIENTIEYLSRLSSEYSRKIDILIIVSSDIKETFNEKLNLNEEYSLNLFTPYEAAKQLNLQDFVATQDKYTDIMLAINLYNQLSPTLRVNTNQLSNLSNLKVASHSIKLFGYSANIAIASLLIISTFELFMLNSDVNFTKNNISLLEARLISEKEQEKGKYTELVNIENQDLNRIDDIVYLYKLLTADHSRFEDPLDILSKFATIKGDNIMVKSFSWEEKENNNRNRYNINEEFENKILEASFAIDFVNAGTSFEQLFADYDNFNNNLKEKFNIYSINISRLPEKITFNDKNRIIPIQVSLIAPKDEK